MKTEDHQRPTLPARSHHDGCPAERVETFTARRADGTAAVVVRCIDCGGQSVTDPSHA